MQVCFYRTLWLALAHLFLFIVSNGAHRLPGEVVTDGTTERFKPRRWSETRNGPYQMVVSGMEKEGLEANESVAYMVALQEKAAKKGDKSALSKGEAKEKPSEIGEVSSKEGYTEKYDKVTQRMAVQKQVRKRGHTLAEEHVGSRKQRRNPIPSPVTTAAPHTMSYNLYNHFRPLEQDVPQDHILPFLDFGRKLTTGIPNAMNSIDSSSTQRIQVADVTSEKVEEEVLHEDMDVTVMKKAVERNTVPKAVAQIRDPVISSFFRKRISDNTTKPVDCHSNYNASLHPLVKKLIEKRMNMTGNSTLCPPIIFKGRPHNANKTLIAGGTGLFENATLNKTDVNFDLQPNESGTKYHKVDSPAQFQSNETSVETKSDNSSTPPNTTAIPSSTPNVTDGPSENKTDAPIPNPIPTAKILSTAVVTSVSVKETQREPTIQQNNTNISSRAPIEKLVNLELLEPKNAKLNFTINRHTPFIFKKSNYTLMAHAINDNRTTTVRPKPTFRPVTFRSPFRRNLTKIIAPVIRVISTPQSYIEVPKIQNQPKLHEGTLRVNSSQAPLSEASTAKQPTTVQSTTSSVHASNTPTTLRTTTTQASTASKTTPTRAATTTRASTTRPSTTFSSTTRLTTTQSATVQSTTTQSSIPSVSTTVFVPPPTEATTVVTRVTEKSSTPLNRAIYFNPSRSRPETTTTTPATTTTKRTLEVEIPKVIIRKFGNVSPTNLSNIEVIAKDQSKETLEIEFKSLENQSRNAGEEELTTEGQPPKVESTVPPPQHTSVKTVIRLDNATINRNPGFLWVYNQRNLNVTKSFDTVGVAYKDTLGAATYVLAVLGVIPLLLGAFVLLRQLVLKSKKKVLDESEYSSEYNRSPLPTKLPRLPAHINWETEKPPVLPTSFKRWEFSRDKLRLQTVLGQGNFGQVWKAEADDISGHEGLTRLVAVKMVKEGASQKEKEDLLRELGIMQDLGAHPNVVTLLGCCTEKEPYLLIMEYVMYGKLLAFLREHRTRAHYFNFSDLSSALTSRDLTVFAYCVARGMEYLVTKGIIHRDLAARNILVDHNKLCKIADFGMSRNVRDTGQIYEQRPNRGALPIRWMAPESLQFCLFTHKADVWSFGILLWEIITLGSTPYATMGAREVIKRVKEGYRLERPKHCKPEFYKVVSKCWNYDPAKRPSFTELRQDFAALLGDKETGGGYVDLEALAEEVNDQHC